MLNNQWVVLVFFMVMCFASAVLGSLSTATSVKNWYAQLRKPALNPPDWIFGPVWTTLYFMMALSAWMVWRSAGWRHARSGLLLFFLQLLLNTLWSGLFFGLRRPGLALIDVHLLLGTIVATAIVFREFSPAAFWLFIPYIAWVTFAAHLNFRLWQLNSEDRGLI